jgi:hypothetical protein
MIYQRDQPEPGGPAPMSQPRTAIDLWVRRALKRQYDPTLQAELPDDLLRLIERFATQH